jgi:hypothetical protein
MLKNLWFRFANDFQSVVKQTVADLNHPDPFRSSKVTDSERWWISKRKLCGYTVQCKNVHKPKYICNSHRWEEEGWPGSVREQTLSWACVSAACSTLLQGIHRPFTHAHTEHSAAKAPRREILLTFRPNQMDLFLRDMFHT